MIGCYKLFPILLVSVGTELYAAENVSRAVNEARTYVVIHNVAAKEACKILKKEQINNVARNLKLIEGRANSFSSMRGGQTKYAAIIVDFGTFSNYETYYFYRVSLNEFGNNYFRVVTKRRNFYATMEDVAPIIDTLRRVKHSSCVREI